MQFADRLVIACNDANLPEKGRQTVLAKKLQISQPAVAKWFSGKSLPTIDKVIDLSKLLNVEIEWLITGKGVKHFDPNKNSDLIKEATSAMSELDATEQQLVVDFVKMMLQRQ